MIKLLKFENKDILFSGDVYPPEINTVTISMTSKWYSLYVVKTDGKVAEYLPNLRKVNYVDDKYHPEQLNEACASEGLLLDEYAYEMIVGRWTIEVDERYCPWG